MPAVVRQWEEFKCADAASQLQGAMGRPWKQSAQPSRPVRIPCQAECWLGCVFESNSANI